MQIYTYLKHGPVWPHCRRCVDQGVLMPTLFALVWACWPCALMLGWIAYAALWG